MVEACFIINFNIKCCPTKFQCLGNSIAIFVLANSRAMKIPYTKV